MVDGPPRHPAPSVVHPEATDTVWLHPFRMWSPGGFHPMVAIAGPDRNRMHAPLHPCRQCWGEGGTRTSDRRKGSPAQPDQYARR